VGGQRRSVAPTVIRLTTVAGPDGRPRL